MLKPERGGDGGDEPAPVANASLRRNLLENTHSFSATQRYAKKTRQSTRDQESAHEVRIETLNCWISTSYAARAGNPPMRAQTPKRERSRGIFMQARGLKYIFSAPSGSCLKSGYGCFVFKVKAVKTFQVVAFSLFSGVCKHVMQRYEKISPV